MITEFTPVQSVIGGLIIGLGAFVLIFFNGKIAGISGIAKGVIRFDRSDLGWRVLFLIGLIAGGGLIVFFRKENTAAHYTSPTGILILSGLAVGIGTAMGNGCTSGHGICGIARLSKRSIIATLCFMAIGVITVYVARHQGGWI